MEASNVHPQIMRRTLLLFAETILRPVIRMLLRFGLSYPEFNQISRKLFVSVAMQEPEFRIPRRRHQYKSRVALLTALSRKEVLRLLEAKRPVDDAELQQSNRAARVLDGWLHDSRFLDERGEPLPLPFKAADGRRSFSLLVADYSGDIPPRAVLDELLATMTCATFGDDDIRIVRREYVARAFDVETMTAAAMRATAYLGKVDSQLAGVESLRDWQEPGVAARARVAHIA